jgi:hypothetical protein
MDINSSAYLKASHTLQAAAKSSEAEANKPSSSCSSCSSFDLHEYEPCSLSAKVLFSSLYGLIFSNQFGWNSPSLLEQQLYIFILDYLFLIAYCQIFQTASKSWE